ncbi:HNH endonuclease [Maritimibacter sp. DP1N21-5]|uniref:HNH endonuclease n=1 Tax=Maritimibacter sp. DP1N21-5 TaxID=2836867 RepID=UPI001C442A76|nr:HNH endonuclease [Maritimibacter sp. DP1N21-5]MBV7408193.1 HNH endonuclease [Maritimibacter sp. DP1N21-5]
MGRLTAPPSRVAKLGTRIAVDHGASRDAVRRKVTPWRAWYSTPRWFRLRQAVFVRDGGVCQKTGVLLVGGKNAPDSPVVDHIVPHRGDPDLFWNIDNLQLVSKAWHDSEKQSQERGG